MDEVRVGIISGDRHFVEEIVQSWRRLPYLPRFTAAADPAELSGEAVVLTDTADKLSRLSSAVVLAIAIVEEENLAGNAAPSCVDGSTRFVRIARRAGWDAEAAALALESVLRLESQAQVAEMKQRLREAERFAALGKFIAEARHGLGNALTGVLGNSELLLLEDDKTLQREARAKVEVIRQMSLQIHETFHRLSSLDSELRRQAELEALKRPSQSGTAATHY